MRLNTENFFRYFVINPYSRRLDAPDRAKALVASVALGILTLGIVHIVAAIRLRNWKQLDPKGVASFQNLREPNPHAPLLKLSQAEQVRYFTNPDNLKALGALKADAKPVYVQLRNSFLEEKKKLPAETVALDWREEFNRWLAKDERWNDEVFKEYFSPWQFAADAVRTAAGEWTINGEVVPGEWATLLEPLVKALFAACDEDIKLLDNFLKIAHQGFMAIAWEGLHEKFGYYDFVNVRDLKRHWNLETTDTQIRLKFSMPSELWGDQSEILGAAQATVEMIIPKADLARGDLSKMQLIRHVSMLQT